MPKTDILRASVSVSSNFLFTGFKRILKMMVLAGAAGAVIIVGLVALIAAIVK